MWNLARAGSRCLARAVSAAGPKLPGAFERAIIHQTRQSFHTVWRTSWGGSPTAASAPLSDQPASGTTAPPAANEWALHVKDLKEAASALAPHDLDAPTVVPVINFARDQVGETELPADIFQKEIRRDILQRVVRWQMAKRQQGTHSAKGRGQVRGGGRKPHPQKKTGNARAGSIRSPLWRGGGVTHGPVPRSHAIGLPKKVRRLGLKVALSAKLAEGRLIILDSASMERGKTKIMAGQLESLLADAPRRSILFLDSGKTDEDGGESLRRSINNLPWVDALPQEGANVYSILQRDYLAITEAALQRLIIRLRTPINR